MAVFSSLKSFNILLHLPGLRFNKCFILITGLILILIFQRAEGKKRKNNRKKITKTQKAGVNFRHPPFVDIENADSYEFVSFLKKLKTLKDGKPGQARILIIGDSHMQCEDFGTALRIYLSDSLHIPYAGRGFAFPYPLARTSQRSDMFFGPSGGWHGCRFTKEGNHCDWGVCGWTARFDKDSATFAWRMGHAEFRQGDEIMLFSPSQNASYQLLMYDSSFSHVQRLIYNPESYAFEGNVMKTTQKLFFNLKRNEPGAEFVHQGFLLKPQKSGFVFSISGTNGARLDHYLQSPYLQKQIIRIDPDMVILCLGTNDVYARNFNTDEIRSYLHLLLSKIKASAPSCAILLAGPPDHCIGRKRANPKTEKINQVFSETAEELDLTFWNLQKAMGGKGSVFRWRRSGLAAKDMVHFEPGGYKKQANLLGSAIKTHFLKLNSAD